jgi:hypothetical protein
MLTFFRRIIKSLLGSGGTGKYLLYAIGEILLVMIGILLALQVNNWNEWRKDRKEEDFILNNLFTEFKINEDLLIRAKEDVNNHYNADLTLMDMMGKPEIENVKKNIDSILYFSWGPLKFSPNQSVLTGLLTSSRIEILSDERLKNLLFQWSSKMLENDDEYAQVNNVSHNKYEDYLTANYSLKDIDRYGDLPWKSGSELIRDKYKIFHDIEYENLLDNMAFVTLHYGKSLDQLHEIIEEILTEIATEIDKR